MVVEVVVVVVTVVVVDVVLVDVVVVLVVGADVAVVDVVTVAVVGLVAPTGCAVQVKRAVRAVQAAPGAEASWSSSGLCSGENVRPRAAMGLSGEIGT